MTDSQEATGKRKVDLKAIDAGTSHKEEAADGTVVHKEVTSQQPHDEELFVVGLLIRSIL